MRLDLLRVRETTISIVSLFLLFITLVACGPTIREGLQEEATAKPTTTPRQQLTLDGGEMLTATQASIWEDQFTLTSPPSTPALHTPQMSVTEYATLSITPIPATTLRPTITSTPTITPAPTLTVVEESALLSELMTTNGGCELPCWWGITPGQTQVQQARDLFVQLGLNRWRDAFDGTYRQLILGHRAEDQAYFPFELVVKMYERSGTVELVVVSSLHQPLDQSGFFISEWEPYALPEVLARLGQPSSVHLFVPPNPGEMGYDLYLIYQQLGVQVRYSVPATYLGEQRFELCFMLVDLLSIEVTLFPPGAHNLVGELTESRVEALPTWTEVIGQDFETFVDAFAEDDLPCIEVLWPSS